MKVLDLFSGIGGFSLGLERAGMETVAFCEIDPFCQKVLRKHWPDVPIFDDVTKLRGEDVGPVDVICGGFPCQDISSAGKKAGIGGIRSSLWREQARLVREIRPKFVIVENSAALLNRGIDDVLGALAEGGYDAEWQCIPAWACGAPHGRDRIWIVGYPNQSREPISPFNDETSWVSISCNGAPTHAERGNQKVGGVMAGIGGIWQSVAWNGLWDDENSPIGMGMDDGVPDRMDRLRSLGNAVVPQIPEMLGRAIMGVSA